MRIRSRRGKSGYGRDVAAGEQPADEIVAARLEIVQEVGAAGAGVGPVDRPPAHQVNPAVAFIHPGQVRLLAAVNPQGQAAARWPASRIRAYAWHPTG
jgi:hypothetical protein